MSAAALLLALTLGQSIAGSPDAGAQPPVVRTLARYLAGADHDTARAELLEALRRDPQDPVLHFNLGVLASADRDWPSAARYFQEAGRLARSAALRARAAQELAWVRAFSEGRAGRGGREAEYLDRLRRAMALARGGLAGAAMKEAGAAAAMFPDRWEAHAVAARVSLSRRQYRDAQRFLSLAIPLAPAGVSARLRSSLAGIRREEQTSAFTAAAARLHAAGDYRAAVEQLRLAIANGADDSVRLWLAYALKQAGAAEEALAQAASLRGSPDRFVSGAARGAIAAWARPVRRP